jgi:AraC-like DNA-binding protein
MLPFAEADIQDSFSIQLLSHSGASKVYRLAYHRILLITKGRGTLQIDEKRFTAKENLLLLISKGQVYRASEDLQMEGYEIAFGDCFWERTPSSTNNCKAVLFNHAADNQCLPLNSSDISALLPHMFALYQEFTADSYINKIDVLAAFLKIIMVKIANIHAALTKGYNNDEKQLYHEFLKLVSQQIDQSHEVADYARQLNITSRRLSDICRRSGGLGAKEIINSQLTTEAKRQLQFTSKAVKDIAYSLNFATPEQFSQFFKKNARYSPSHYRSYFVNIDRQNDNSDNSRHMTADNFAS